jgi:hypothetical protein
VRPNVLFLFAGVLALAFGLGFLLVPATVLPVYGVQPEPATALMSRFFGVALVQLGLVLILIREVRDAVAIRALALAGVLGSISGVLVALIGVTSGLTNALGWSTVGIYGVLLLGYFGCLRGQQSLA